MKRIIFKDGYEKILKKSAGVSNVSITKDILKIMSLSNKRTRQEGRILPESKNPKVIFLEQDII